MNDLLQVGALGDTSPTTALTALLLAFALSQVLAQVYMRTFRGLSYSRAFVQGVVMGPIVTCMLMLAIGDSIAAGVALAGGMSIVRFRTTMRDPRDMVFIFGALAIGVACGLKSFAVAAAGTGVFSLAAFALHLTQYGARSEYDGLVRFTVPSSPDLASQVQGVLNAHTRRHALVTLREASQAQHMEHAYQVLMPDPARRAALVSALEGVDGLHDLTLHMQEPTLEL